MNKLLANWSAPPNIFAMTTTREIGRSQAPYDSNNLALHVGDKEEDVVENRRRLVQALSLANEPVWLEQTHSNLAVIVENESNRIADAAITRQKNTPLAIMTADCLPIVLCNQNGSEIAAIHAGWRGLAHGIIDNTIAKMASKPETLMAWIGPAICQNCYETGEEVVQIFFERYPITKTTFQKRDAHQYANLAKMAELILNEQGVKAVYQAAACTFEQKKYFFSYRRQAQTGRMATLIWLI